MLQLGGVEARAVVVDAAGAVDDLVAAVAVHVADAQVVRALLLILDPLVAVGEGVEAPALGELAAAPVPGFQDGAGVVAAADQDARALPVEVAGTAEEAIHAVALEVAEGDLVLPRDEIGARQLLAGRALDHGEEFRSVEDHAVGARLRVEVAVVGAAVAVGVADHGPVAELRAFGGLDGKFGLAVAVKVVQAHLRVVRALADVQAQVHAPQEGAVELVGVDQQTFVADAGAGVVVGAGFELDHDLVFAVPIEVADRGVIGGIVPFGEALHRLDGDLQVGFRGAGGRQRVRSAGLDCGLAREAHGVGVVHGRVHLRVREEGGFHERGVIQLDVPAIEVESDVERVALLVAPGHGHLAASVVDGDQAAVQLLFLDLGAVVGPRFGHGLPAARCRKEDQRQEKKHPFHLLYNWL